MIVWTGHGWLAGGVLIGSWLLAEQVAGDKVFQDVPATMFFVLSCSITCYALGRLLNRQVPRKFFDYPRSVLNPDTGEAEYQSSEGHTFAFVRVEYAGLFSVVMGAFALLHHLGVLP